MGCISINYFAVVGVYEGRENYSECFACDGYSIQPGAKLIAACHMGGQ
jgi:hypothetical protein